MIKDVTDASDWSKRFNFYISGLLPIFSEFSRFISRFSELKKAPSTEDLWSKDFLQAPAISIKIRVNYCQLIKKRDLSSNSWYFSFYIMVFTIGNHQNHQKLYFLLKSKLFKSKVPQFLQIHLQIDLKMTLK